MFVKVWPNLNILCRFGLSSKLVKYYHASDRIKKEYLSTIKLIISLTLNILPKS